MCFNHKGQDSFPKSGTNGLASESIELNGVRAGSKVLRSLFKHKRLVIELKSKLPRRDASMSLMLTSV